jgi:hypothetical protein
MFFLVQAQVFVNVQQTLFFLVQAHVCVCVQALQFFSDEAQVFVCVQETNSSFSNYLVISSSVCLCARNADFS